MLFSIGTIATLAARFFLLGAFNCFYLHSLFALLAILSTLHRKRRRDSSESLFCLST